MRPGFQGAGVGLPQIIDKATNSRATSAYGHERPLAATTPDGRTEFATDRSRNIAKSLRAAECLTELGDCSNGIGLRLSLIVVRVIDKKLIGVRSGPL